jgi:hypothetical protein
MDEVFDLGSSQIQIADEYLEKIKESTDKECGFWTLKPTYHDYFINNLQQIFESVTYIHGAYHTETVCLKLVYKDKKHYVVLLSDDDDYSDDENVVAFSFFNAVGVIPSSYKAIHECED